MAEITIALALVAAFGILAYPSMRICHRLGVPTALGALAAVPIANLVLLWFVAHARWPSVDPPRPDSGRPESTTMSIQRLRGGTGSM